jgi:hypothetical protein
MNETHTQPPPPENDFNGSITARLHAIGKRTSRSTHPANLVEFAKLRRPIYQDFPDKNH